MKTYIYTTVNYSRRLSKLYIMRMVCLLGVTAGELKQLLLYVKGLYHIIGSEM